MAAPLRWRVGSRGRFRHWTKNLPVDRISTLERVAGLRSRRNVARLHCLLYSECSRLRWRALGFYGVLAYSVWAASTGDWHPDGIGANISQILKLIIGQGATLMFIRVVFGLLIAFIATRAITSMLLESRLQTNGILYSVANSVWEQRLSLATFPRGAQRSIRWWRLGMNDCGKNDVVLRTVLPIAYRYLFDGLIVEEETAGVHSRGELKESGFRRVSLFA